MSDAARLDAILRDSPRVMTMLRLTRGLGLRDWRLFSGGVYQTVWNALTGRAPDYGIKDYDLAYFDPDTSWDAEDAVIRQVASAMPAPLDAMTEVRNQARVHLWFGQRFGGEAYAPLANTDEAIGRFVCPAFAVAVRLEVDDAISLAAPFGLHDVFAMRLRRNPSRPIPDEAFARTTAGVKARWPELTIEG